MDFRKMSRAELKIMELLWKNSEGLESNILYDTFKEYAYSTVSTRLGRMEKKGFIVRERKGRHHVIFPLISKEEYFNTIKEENFDKTCKTLELIISCFDGQKITENQYDKLKKMLDGMRND